MRGSAATQDIRLASVWLSYLLPSAADAAACSDSCGRVVIGSLECSSGGGLGGLAVGGGTVCRLGRHSSFLVHGRSIGCRRIVLAVDAWHYRVVACGPLSFPSRQLLQLGVRLRCGLQPPCVPSNAQSFALGLLRARLGRRSGNYPECRVVSPLCARGSLSGSSRSPRLTSVQSLSCLYFVPPPLCAAHSRDPLAHSCARLGRRIQFRRFPCGVVFDVDDGRGVSG